MKNILAKVINLYITQSSESPRVVVDELKVDVNGVIGDKFYGQDSNRLILVTSYDAYTMARELNIELEDGALGENILIDGSIKELTVGDQFIIGDQTFEITQNCTLCNGLSKINSKLPKLLKDDRGIFVKAIGNGIIKKSDTICL